MTNQNARKRKIQADGEPRDHNTGGENWIFILFYPGKACSKQTFGSTEAWFYLGLKRLGSDARWANRNLLSGRVWALDAKERRVVSYWWCFIFEFAGNQGLPDSKANNQRERFLRQLPKSLSRQQHVMN